MDAVSLAAVTVIVALFLVWRQYVRRTYNSPPGPTYIFPFIGNMFQMDPNKPQLSLTTWAAQYGDMYKIHILGSDIIVLSGYDTIRDALITRMDAFAGRPELFRFLYFYSFDIHITFNDISPRCIEVKKAVMNAMKMYTGDGRESLQAICADAIDKFLESIASHGGEPFDPLDITQIAVVEVIYSAVFGRTLGSEDARKVTELQFRLNELTAMAGAGAELDLAPWIRHFGNRTFKEITKLREESNQFYDAEINARKLLYSQVSDPACVLDVFLKNEKHSGEQEGNCRFTCGEMRAVVTELIAAGLLTSSSVVYSLMALCVTKPEIQDRLQADIDDVIGSRPPRLADKAQLPYVEAAIFEILRYLSHVPIVIPHKTTEDVDIMGYMVPKDTEVYINVWALHHDTRYWDDPWRYNPERFLTDEGTLVPPDHPNRKHLLPFGAGRRVCPGEVLAKNRLFLFVTSLLQRFRFVPEADDKLPDPDPRTFDLGVVLFPNRYKLRAVNRE